MFPTWDLVITIVFLVIAGYNFILQRERVVNLIISAYIGLALASVWGISLTSFLGSNSSLLTRLTDSDATLSSTQIGIFVIFTLVLTIKSEYAQIPKKSFGLFTPVFVVLFSIFSAFLIFASVFSFLDERTLLSLLEQSNLANLIYRFQLWFFVLPAILMIVTGFLTKSRSHHPSD